MEEGRSPWRWQRKGLICPGGVGKLLVLARLWSMPGCAGNGTVPLPVLASVVLRTGRFSEGDYTIYIEQHAAGGERCPVCPCLWRVGSAPCSSWHFQPVTPVTAIDNILAGPSFGRLAASKIRWPARKCGTGVRKPAANKVGTAGPVIPWIETAPETGPTDTARSRIENPRPLSWLVRPGFLTYCDRQV